MGQQGQSVGLDVGNDSEFIDAQDTTGRSEVGTESDSLVARCPVVHLCRTSWT
jgi:hypothetical protein